MRFGHRMQEEVLEIQLAPLIDIVFITLVFFVTTMAFSRIESQIGIELPTASRAVQAERTRGEIYINLCKDGRIVLNGREMTLDQLQDVLNRVAEHFPGGAVIIRGDQEALLGGAIGILNCCKKADIQDIAFAALKEDTTTSGAALPATAPASAPRPPETR